MRTKTEETKSGEIKTLDLPTPPVKRPELPPLHLETATSEEYITPKSIPTENFFRDRLLLKIDTNSETLDITSEPQEEANDTSPLNIAPHQLFASISSQKTRLTTHSVMDILQRAGVRAINNPTERLDLLGLGAEGEVYQWGELALKIQRPKWTSTPTQYEIHSATRSFAHQMIIHDLLSREAGHENNIITFSGHCQHDGTIGFAMPLMHNSLDHLLKVHQVDDFGTKRQYLQSITQSVQYVHSHNILHNDVTSRNFLLAPNGHLVLTDFGISRYIGNDRDFLRLLNELNESEESFSDPFNTNSGAAIQWRAPEKSWFKNSDCFFINSSDNSLLESMKSSDIYSLGLVMWEILTGTYLSPDEKSGLTWPANNSQRIHQIETQWAAATPELRSEFQPIYETILRCISDTPATRPTIEEIVAVVSLLTPEQGSGVRL